MAKSGSHTTKSEFDDAFFKIIVEAYKHSQLRSKAGLVQSIDTAHSWDEYGLDSLDLIQIVMEIDREMGIDLESLDDRACFSSTIAELYHRTVLAYVYGMDHDSKIVDHSDFLVRKFVENFGLPTTVSAFDERWNAKRFRKWVLPLGDEFTIPNAIPVN